ncbi:TolC family protein [Thermodesulfobacteriota bacterium]
MGLASSDSDLTKSGGSSLGDLFKGNSLAYTAGAGFRWDIFNYGRIKNQVRVQDARFQGLVVNYENTVLKATQEVEDAMVAFLRSQEEASYLLDAVEASKRSVDLSMIQYREGLVDYQRVIDTQRTLAQSEDLHATTFGSVSVNLISMYKALGGGWEIREGKPFVPEEIIKQMEERTDWGSMLTPEKLEPPKEEERQDWRWPDW